MSLTVRQYAGLLRQAATPLAIRMGVDLSQAPRELRVMLRIQLGIFGGVIKMLVDKGVMTDAEFMGMVNLLTGDTYPGEPLDPPEPTIPAYAQAGTATATGTAYNATVTVVE